MRCQPVLRFTPTAWAKILFFRDHGRTEIGGFGITAEDDLLLIEDFVTVEQKVSSVTVAFDDEAVADFFDAQVDEGKRPEQFARCWCHTHPGDSAVPSMTDEETFNRVFGRCQYAVMMVLAKGGKTYARLRFTVGPGGDLLIPVEVDYSQPFSGSDFKAWKKEYQANVQAMLFGSVYEPLGHEVAEVETEPFGSRLDPTEITLDDLAQMDPMERDLVLAELGYFEGEGWDELKARQEVVFP
jgi:hypothetical protein